MSAFTRGKGQVRGKRVNLKIKLKRKKELK
jgi:hypothetical protein